MADRVEDSVEDQTKNCESDTDKFCGLPSFFYSYGMDCRLHSGQRFKGVLKAVPEDFIVTEIDLNGKMVELNKTISIIPPPSNVVNPSSLSPKVFMKNTTASTSETASGTDNDISLSEKQIAMLSEFSGKWKHFAASRTFCNISSRTTPFNESLDLGYYSDRHNRITIHEEVKKLFPACFTRTIYEGENSKIVVLPDFAYQRLLPLIGEQEALELLKFIKLTNSSSNECYQLSAKMSKEERTKIHQTINELYGVFLETKAISSSSPMTLSSSRKRMRELIPSQQSQVHDEEAKLIVVKFKRKSMRMEKKKQPINPSYFTKFVLKKENLETLQATKMLANSLNVGTEQFKMAGTKDKKAITLQNVTAKDISMARLSSVICPGLELGSFKYVDRHLSLGHLKGNHFKIRIRNTYLKNDEGQNLQDVIKSSMNSLESNGFINYYGVQRFGKIHDEHPIVTPLVGLYLLLDDPEKAIKLILKPVGNYTGSHRKAKELFTSTSDVKGAIPLMTGATLELMILRALNRYGTSKFGYQRAFLSLPHDTRAMYTHSFTSLLWNHLASYRIQEYGNKPVEGDLVQVDTVASVRDRVIPITSDDIRSGQYSIKDVVLPLPGYQVVPPSNKVGKRLFDLLSALGLSLLSFRCHRFINKAPGTYRKLITFPQDLKWEIGTPPLLTAPPRATPTDITDTISSSCINLEFKLESGSYVTTMLNEILI